MSSHIQDVGFCQRCGGETGLVTDPDHRQWLRCSGVECEEWRRRRRAQQLASALRIAAGSEEYPPSRPTPEALAESYLAGVKFEEAVEEAQRLLADGVPEADVREQVGFEPTARRIVVEARRRVTASKARELLCDGAPFPELGVAPRDVKPVMRDLAREFSRHPEAEDAA